MTLGKTVTIPVTLPQIVELHGGGMAVNKSHVDYARNHRRFNHFQIPGRGAGGKRIVPGNQDATNRRGLRAGLVSGINRLVQIHQREAVGIGFIDIFSIIVRPDVRPYTVGEHGRF